MHSQEKIFSKHVLSQIIIFPMSALSFQGAGIAPQLLAQAKVGDTLESTLCSALPLHWLNWLSLSAVESSSGFCSERSHRVFNEQHSCSEHKGPCYVLNIEWTHIKGLSRRLPSEPTTSPSVQKAWPRKSCTHTTPPQESHHATEHASLGPVSQPPKHDIKEAHSEHNTFVSRT